MLRAARKPPRSPWRTLCTIHLHDIESPARLGCSPKITFTLNRGQIGAQVTATDTGTSKSCATFVDKVAAGGLQATLTNAPYADGSLATVDVDLRP